MQSVSLKAEVTWNRPPEEGERNIAVVCVRRISFHFSTIFKRQSAVAGRHSGRIVLVAGEIGKSVWKTTVKLQLSTEINVWSP